ncbi:DAK2 domain fusion protein YloV [Gottschalkia acidurici 9a]|uniref:DAK2 domain fusion protein YloV n=1 Tax=Gottschalkia acidurici (strain ATCC 7906 / DSM 604 / BCRC 14475 / CIP 104303 / KCTC 5404 / NCIMB 10678 / 9a) TaxID=1128398 RepID=K0AY04_GOTA9|nr:DAK2 domain-containing protein [Gottschalkia acidurici]AFS78678.1 DAK2 domain fusion protein YloV [Gottschalkia acidurici 9a]
MKIEYVDGSLLKKMFIGATNSLEKNKEMVNALNVFPVPDGDTGTNMSLTMQSATKRLKSSDVEDIEAVGTLVSNGSLMGARGNSGVILSQLLRGLAKGLKESKKVNTKVLALAFKEGADTAYGAVMKPIEGTILTVARECAEKAVEVAKTQDDIVEFLIQVIKHGEAALDKTPEMLPVLKEAGVVDAGGKGLIVLLNGALSVLTGKEDITYEIQEPIKDVSLNEINTEIEFGYCTEFIVNKNKEDSEVFAKRIGDYGDSMLVIGGDGFIKVHIHTNNPGLVLQKATDIGELIDIKIDNMRYQHSNNIESGQKITKKYGFITVAMGDGIKAVFEDLNVDHIISGGQTMNPSTEDILKAAQNINAENIIILPNNSNIILAAKQAKELSSKNIEVLPTKTIPQGIAALLAFNEDIDLQDNVENMTKSFSEIKTAQVTFSVRDTTINEKEIRKDDIIGICEGDITSVGKDIEEVTLELIKNSLTEENELITLFYGEDVSEEDGKKIVETLEDNYPDIDIELLYGGQPIYYYLIAIE